MTVKRCEYCRWWENDRGGLCAIGWQETPRGPYGHCGLFSLKGDVGSRESAIREAGLEREYAEALLVRAYPDAMMHNGCMMFCDAAAKLERAVIALAALTEAQRATAARETLEEAE